MDETVRDRVRLVVQSERRLAREALVACLDAAPDFDVVGNTAAVEQLSTLCSLRRPQVVLVDAGALRMETVEALRDLRIAYPAVGIVVTYVESRPPVLDAARSAGITALVPCPDGLQALLQVLRRPGATAAHPRQGESTLTKRDIEVVSLLSAGHSTPEIARLLSISPHTVENHKRRIYAKLGVGNQSHAVSRATFLGLLDAPGPTPNCDHSANGRSLLVVVHGATGVAADRVVMALLRHGLPFVIVLVAASLEKDHWVQWHRGPLVVALIDPSNEHWLVPASLRAPTVVVTSGHPHPRVAVDALERGAQAVVTSDDRADDLCAVLSLAARGYRALSPRYMESIPDWIAARSSEWPATVPELTPREHDILDSIAKGHTVRQTARTLGIAAKTVENTQSRLFRKLNTRNRSETLTIAHQMGLIDLPESQWRPIRECQPNAPVQSAMARPISSGESSWRK